MMRKRRGPDFPPRPKTEGEQLQAKLHRITLHGETAPGEIDNLIQEYIEKRKQDLIPLKYNSTLTNGAYKEHARKVEDALSRLEEFTLPELSLESSGRVYDAIAAEEAEYESLKESLGGKTEQQSTEAQDTAPESLPLSALKLEEASVEQYDTPKEATEALRNNIGNYETHKLHESMQADIEKSQKDYFDAIKDFQKERTALGIKAEDYVGELSSKELKELRNTWIEKRAALWNFQSKTAEERFKDRPRTRDEVLEGLKNYRGKGHLSPELIKARYERRSMVQNILGREEAEQQARVDGLDGRDKGRVERLMDWHKKQPAWVKTASTSALMFGGGALLSLSGIGAGVGAAAVVFAGTRTGLRWVAEARKDKNPWVSKFANSLVMATSVAGAASYAANKATKAIHSFEGTEAKAAATLSQKEGFGRGHTSESFAALATERKKALGAKERVERHGRVAGMLTSLGLGFLVGHSAGHHDAHAESGITDEVVPTNLGTTNNTEVPPVADIVPTHEVTPVPDTAPEAENIVSHTETSPVAAAPAHIEHPQAQVEAVRPHVSSTNHHERTEVASEAKSETPNDPAYVSQFANRHITLPEGMDPNSPEATAYLDRAYNKDVDFSHVGTPAPSATPAEATPAASVESVPPAQPENIVAPVTPSAPTPSPEVPVAVPHTPETVVPHETAAPAPHPAENHALEDATHNEFGLDLTKPSVGLDPQGHAFVHVPETSNSDAFNKASYDVAYAFSEKHPNVPVYYIDRGGIHPQVLALSFPEGAQIPQPYTDDGAGHIYDMPPIPKDSDLKPIK